ncbi:MAG TPA: hypothetical protein VGE52_19300 [Pirellulales bacterium]
MRRAFGLLLAGALSWSSGCGGAPPAAPETTTSATTAAASAANGPATSGGSPTPPERAAPTATGTSLETPPASLEQPVAEAPAVPATYTQLVDAIDLRAIPIPEDAALEGTRAIRGVSMSLKRDPAAVAAFLREQMTKLGASEVKSDTPDAPPYLNLSFTKSGVLVSVSISPDDARPGMTTFVATNHGNVNAALLPVLDGATPLYVGPHSAMRLSPESVSKTAEATRELLLKAGWRDHLPADRGPALPESDDQRFLNFFQNAIHLNVYVAKAAGQDGKTTLQYNMSVLDGEFPFPPDATDPAFGPRPGEAICRSALAPPALGAFYRAKFKELGWAPRKDEASGEELGNVSDSLVLLVMQRGNDVVFVEGRPAETGCKVTLRAMIDKTPDDEKAAAERVEKAIAERDTNPIDLPLPPDARQASYEEKGQRVKFKSALSIRELIEFYAKSFGEAGFKENAGDRKIEGKTGHYSAIRDNDDRIFVNIFRQNDETGSEVTASAYGCTWKKPAAPLEQPDDAK